MVNPKIRAVVLFLILIFSGHSVSAAVSISDGWVEGLAARTVTESATGNQLCLVLAVAEEGSGQFTRTSVTWGGQSMTLGVGAHVGTGDFNNDAAFWYLKEADWPGTPGSATFVITYSNIPDDNDMASVILDGVDQTTPIGDATSSFDNSTYGASVTLGIDVTADGYSSIGSEASSSGRTYDSWLKATEQLEFTGPGGSSAAVGHQLETSTTTNTAGFTLSSSATRGCTVAIGITAAGGAPPTLPNKRRKVILGL